jgi:hypothetical protein
MSVDLRASEISRNIEFRLKRNSALRLRKGLTGLVGGEYSSSRSIKRFKSGILRKRLLGISEELTQGVTYRIDFSENVS